MNVLRCFFFFSILFLINHSSIGQVFNRDRMYPANQIVFVKYFQGSGGKGYKTVYYTNDKGRMISSSDFKKSELLLTKKFTYNSEGDFKMVITSFDINHPDQADTVFYKYEYDSRGYITREISKNTLGHFKELQLISVTGNEYTYTEHNHYNQMDNDSVSLVHKLTYDETQNLIKWQAIDKKLKSTRILEYYYNNNNLLIRKIETNIPEPSEKPIYVGGYGGNDVRYQYKLDNRGRIKKEYLLLDGKKFLLATYRYSVYH